MRLLVTGFGPFLQIKENPSEWLAEHCGAQHAILQVSFHAVDSFLDALQQEPPSALLMIGVAAKRRQMCLERVGNNWVGPGEDVLGKRRGPANIDPAGPAGRAATLWARGDRLDRRAMRYSLDAGDYLCNYALHEALRHLPRTRTGFLHIPPFEVLAREQQLALLKTLITRIEQRFQ